MNYVVPPLNQSHIVRERKICNADFDVFHIMPMLLDLWWGQCLSKFTQNWNYPTWIMCWISMTHQPSYPNNTMYYRLWVFSPWYHVTDIVAQHHQTICKHNMKHNFYWMCIAFVSQEGWKMVSETILSPGPSIAYLSQAPSACLCVSRSLCVHISVCLPLWVRVSLCICTHQVD